MPDQDVGGDGHVVFGMDQMVAAERIDVTVQSSAEWECGMRNAECVFSHSSFNRVFFRRRHADPYASRHFVLGKSGGDC
jgi:hypothetical protein